MQKLDSEKFRTALEAIAVEKAKRCKAAAARPRASPQTGTPMPPADFEVLLDNRRPRAEVWRPSFSARHL